MSPLAKPGDSATQADKANAMAVRAAAPKALSAVRAAATKWQAGLAGLSGATALLGLIKGRDDVSALKDFWGPGYGIAIGVGLALSVAAGMCAMRAAYGYPVIVRTKDRHLLATTERGAAITAAKFLRAAIWLTALSLTVLGVGVGIAWYGPQSSGPSIMVHTAKGTYCGTVDSIGGDALKLKTSGGSDTIGLAKADQIQAVGSC